ATAPRECLGYFLTESAHSTSTATLVSQDSGWGLSTCPRPQHISLTPYLGISVPKLSPRPLPFPLCGWFYPRDQRLHRSQRLREFQYDPWVRGKIVVTSLTLASSKNQKASFSKIR